MKKKIAVIFGGKSPEHEVSIESAKTVCARLREAGFAVLPSGDGRPAGRPSPEGPRP